MSVMVSDSQSLHARGFAAIAADCLKEGLSGQALSEFPLVQKSFENLVQDTQMGDGGRYRFRRYSRFRLLQVTGEAPRLEPVLGNSIHQLLEDNPLNGGVTRTFQPLEADLMGSSFLSELVLQDAETVLSVEPELRSSTLVVGVHQVRIVATEAEQGKPAPEGVHRDAERYTFQHFWARDSVVGGEFVAYDCQKTETFRWLQQERLDSVVFKGSTWHSATPIRCRPGVSRGFRDIFLVDFDLL